MKKIILALLLIISNNVMAMEVQTIKINELATRSLNSSDYFIKGEGSMMYKNTLSTLANFISTVGAVAYGGSLAIADTPTQDGFYFASESGTYANAGGLVVDLNEGINIISVTEGQTVFEKVVVPVDISGQLSTDTEDVLNEDKGFSLRGVALNELADVYEDKSVISTVNTKEFNLIRGLVDFWVDDVSAASSMEFRIRGIYTNDGSVSDRFGVREVSSGDSFWSHNTGLSSYLELNWNDKKYHYFKLYYNGLGLNFVWDSEHINTIPDNTNDSNINHILINRGEPSTSLGQNLLNEYKVGNGLVIATLGDSITMNMSSNIPSLPATCGDHDNQDWPTLQSRMGFSEVINIGIGGAQWQDRGDENITDCPVRSSNTGTASNCIRMLKRLISDNNRPTPDIITFAFGTNNPTPDGDYETVMNMTFSELENDEVYRQTMYGGIRYSLEVVTRDFPNAQIVLLCPMQSNTSSRPIEDLKKVGDIIKEMGRRYSCTVIDLYGELGVVDKYENDGSNGRYLSDGVHLNGRGKKLYTEFLAKKLKDIIVTER